MYGTGLDNIYQLPFYGGAQYLTSVSDEENTYYPFTTSEELKIDPRPFVISEEALAGYRRCIKWKRLTSGVED